MKQTKIIATLGPASGTPDMIKQLINAGVDVFRINFSHGTREVQQKNIGNIREAAKELGKVVAIMGDLQGPKIRVSKFAEGKVELKPDQSFILDCAYKELGNDTIVGVDYAQLAGDVAAGDTLLLDDGKIALIVEKVQGDKVYTKVTQAG